MITADEIRAKFPLWRSPDVRSFLWWSQEPYQDLYFPYKFSDSLKEEISLECYERLYNGCASVIRAKNTEDLKRWLNG